MFRLPSSVWVVLGLSIVLDLTLVHFHLERGGETFVFHLNHEHNVPAFYQGFKYLLASTAAFGLAYSDWISPQRITFFRSFWLLFWGLFGFFALDEVGLFHEHTEAYLLEFWPGLQNLLVRFAAAINYTGASWLVVYGLSGVLLLPVVIRTLLFSWRQYRPRSLWLYAGFALMIGGAVGVEYLTTAKIISDEQIIYEEAFEMLGLSVASVFVFGEFLRRTRSVQVLSARLPVSSLPESSE